MSALDKYNAALANPAPHGQGHTWLLSTANYAALAGIDPTEAAAAIKDARPSKSARDIRAAVTKAYADRGDARRPYVAVRPPIKPKIDTVGTYARCLAAHPDPFPELWEASPVRLHDDVDGDLDLLLDTAWKPENHVFFGDRESGVLGRNVKTVREWKRNPPKDGPFLALNPLTGKPSPGGGYRGNACVAEWRYVLVEFDDVSLEAQAAFWLSHRLPVFAIVHSANKSLHAWIRFETEEQRGRLKRLFTGLGSDPQVWYPGCMTRRPGHYRTDYDPTDTPPDPPSRFQRILYLDPNARGIAA